MLTLTSTAFGHGGTIPREYTCDGERTKNPPLLFSGIPETAVSLALIVDDPDVPKQIKSDGVFDHLVLFNIAPGETVIAAGAYQDDSGRYTFGINGRGEEGYTGPCPPPQYEPREHRYFFRLYALDTMLPLERGATKEQVLAAMESHVIEQAELMGRYARE